MPNMVGNSEEKEMAWSVSKGRRKKDTTFELHPGRANRIPVDNEEMIVKEMFEVPDVPYWEYTSESTHARNGKLGRAWASKGLCNLPRMLDFSP